MMESALGIRGKGSIQQGEQDTVCIYPAELKKAKMMPLLVLHRSLDQAMNR